MSISHQSVDVDGTAVHVASAGRGEPLLAVHGFPETWQVFEGLMEELAPHHQVLAVDLPGFGASDHLPEAGSERLADVLARLLEVLGCGPVHLVGQDISGALTYRVAATRPDLVKSWTAIETALPGFGWEAFADVAHSGAWYIGMLATPGVPELLLTGRERVFLEEWILRPQSAAPLRPELVGALVSSYETTGFEAATAIYRSLLSEGEEIRALARQPLQMPVCAISRSSGGLVVESVGGVAPDLTAETVSEVGHYIAAEAPRELAQILRRRLADG